MAGETGAETTHQRDLQLAGRIVQRDAASIATLMQQNNRRLFRVAWSILANRHDAEDAVQNTYLLAFTSMASFEGRSSLSTWLTRIVVNEALKRRRVQRQHLERFANASAVAVAHYREKLMGAWDGFGQPDAALAREQIRERLEGALVRVPEKFRIVFVLREIEEMKVAEVAALLEIPPATVKTRHLRAKGCLRRALGVDVTDVLPESVPFAGEECKTLTERVVALFCLGHV